MSIYDKQINNRLTKEELKELKDQQVKQIKDSFQEYRGKAFRKQIIEFLLGLSIYAAVITFWINNNLIFIAIITGVLAVLDVFVK